MFTKIIDSETSFLLFDDINITKGIICNGMKNAFICTEPDTENDDKL